MKPLQAALIQKLQNMVMNHSPIKILIHDDGVLTGSQECVGMAKAVTNEWAVIVSSACFGDW